MLNTQISLTGTPEVIGRKMVDRYVINPTDAGRKISQVKLGELKGIGAECHGYGYRRQPGRQAL